jgi:hypothetical protein
MKSVSKTKNNLLFACILNKSITFVPEIEGNNESI